MKDCSKYGELMAILEDRVFFHSVCNQYTISKTNVFEATLVWGFFGGCASGIDALVWKYWSKKGLGIWLYFCGCENGERKGFDGQVPRGSSIRCLEEQLWRGTHLTWLGCFSSKPHPVPFLACRESHDSPSICSFLLCKQTMVVHAGKDGKGLRITYSAFNSSTHNLHTHSHWNCKFRV